MVRISKAAHGGISFFLVVAVVFGVAATALQSNESDIHIMTTSKAVTAMCAHTAHKSHCSRSLASVGNNHGASSTDYIKAAIESALKAVSSALHLSGDLIKKAGQPRQKMAMEDCKDLLQFAVDELQASFSSVGDSKHSMNDRVDELKNWLSAVISYQDTCLDGVQDNHLKQEMSHGLLNATQLTSNALAIVSKINGILSNFGFVLDLNNRKLDETHQHSVDQFPSWMSSKDRKLLARQTRGGVRPNAVVAKDGSGQYKTINAALAAYPKNHRGRYVIYVKAGIYKEQVLVTKNQRNVFMYGDGPRRTLVTGRLNFRDGTSTYRTASFAAVGSGFLCKSMGFENTAGPQGHQAVALRVQSDMSAFFNCRMDGYQDTLYTQTHRQFYRNCVITGTIDFIFGDAAVVIQNSQIIARMPMANQKNIVTASGRVDKNEDTGIIIQNCQIIPEQKLFPARFKVPTYLGRPWRKYARTVYLESTLGDLINPQGWLPWQGNFALDTLYYAEYNNVGPGAATGKRVHWKGYKVIKNRNEAQQFTAGPFLKANTWLPATTVPFFAGFKA